MGRTIVEYKGGMEFVGKVASGHDVRMDAGDSVGGADSAPRPVEVLLSSLGGCTGMDVVSVLRKMKTEPKSLQIEIQDERATEYPKVWCLPSFSWGRVSTIFFMCHDSPSSSDRAT